MTKERAAHCYSSRHEVLHHHGDTSAWLEGEQEILQIEIQQTLVKEDSADSTSRLVAFWPCLSLCTGLSRIPTVSEEPALRCYSSRQEVLGWMPFNLEHCNCCFDFCFVTAMLRIKSST